MSRREIFKGKIKDLKNNVNSRKVVLKNIPEIYHHWQQIKDYFFLKERLNEMLREDDS